MRQLQIRYEVTDDVILCIDKALQYSNIQSKSLLDLDTGPSAAVTAACYVTGSSNTNTTHFQSIGDTSIRSRRIYPQPGGRTKTWGEIVVRDPHSYLRLSVSLDYALARGQFPDEDNLRVLFSHLAISAPSSPWGACRSYTYESPVRQALECSFSNPSDFQHNISQYQPFQDFEEGITGDVIDPGAPASSTSADYGIEPADIDPSSLGQRFSAYSDGEYSNLNLFDLGYDNWNMESDIGRVGLETLASDPATEQVFDIFCE